MQWFHSLIQQLKIKSWFMQKPTRSFPFDIGDRTIKVYDPETYLSLPIAERLVFFLETVDMIAPGRVSRFIRDTYRVGTKILLQEPKNGKVEGLSKFGGLPMARAGFEFPTDSAGNPSLFIAQIHIGEFNQWLSSTRELSAEGIIYFFGTLTNQGEYWYIKDVLARYSEHLSDLKSIPLPASLERFGTFPERDLMIIEGIDFPDYNTSTIDLLDLNEEEESQFNDVEEFAEFYRHLADMQLLGVAKPVQHCVLFETETKARKILDYSGEKYESEEFTETYMKLRDKVQDWRVLLEFDTLNIPKPLNFTPASHFGGDGVYYLMIRQEDVTNMRLEKAITVFQTS